MGLVFKHYIRIIGEPALAAEMAGRSVALLLLDLNQAKLCKTTLWKLLGNGSNIYLLYGNSSRIPGKRGRLGPGEQPLIGIKELPTVLLSYGSWLLTTNMPSKMCPLA